MRIAHVTATFPPYQGGTGNVCYHNARELAHRGHEVHVFTPSVTTSGTEEIIEKIKVHRLRPFIKVGNASLLPQLLRPLKGFDLIHLHYPFFGGEATSLAAFLHGIPLVITYHHDVILSGWKGLVEKIMRNTMGYATFRIASLLLFTTIDYGQVSYIHKLMKSHKFAFDELPNGVNIMRFSPCEPPTSLYQRFRISSEDQVVLMVATLDQAHYFKGIPVLLKAIKQLPEHVKGLVIGDGDLRHVYESLAIELGVGHRVFFAGRVPDQDLPDFYRLADVIALPSVQMGEAFGLVLLEAMACMKPVIASNLPGVRVVVSHGRDGLLVEPGNPVALADAIQTILNDDHLRQAMGWQGRAKVEARYSWQQIADHLEGIYLRVVKEAKEITHLDTYQEQ